MLLDAAFFHSDCQQHVWGCFGDQGCAFAIGQPCEVNGTSTLWAMIYYGHDFKHQSKSNVNWSSPGKWALLKFFTGFIQKLCHFMQAHKLCSLWQSGQLNCKLCFSAILAKWTVNVLEALEWSTPPQLPVFLSERDTVSDVPRACFILPISRPDSSPTFFFLSGGMSTEA